MLPKPVGHAKVRKMIRIRAGKIPFLVNAVKPINYSLDFVYGTTGPAMLGSYVGDADLHGFPYKPRSFSDVTRAKRQF